VLIFGIVLLAASAGWMTAMFVWAHWDLDMDVGRKPRDEWSPLRQVPPRYLAMAAVGAIVGAALIAASAG
jgi:hypothetical protein